MDEIEIIYQQIIQRMVQLHAIMYGNQRPNEEQMEIADQLINLISSDMENLQEIFRERQEAYRSNYPPAA